MDAGRFDALVRALAAGATRRGALALLAAAAATGGLAGRVSALDRSGDPVRTDGPSTSRRKRRRHACKPSCPAGQTCDRHTRTCSCDDGGAVCGGACCPAGTDCRDGACVPVDPGQCLPLLSSCAGASRPCCPGLLCAAAADGQGEVACRAAAGGDCGSTLDCASGTTCVDGACAGCRGCVNVAGRCLSGSDPAACGAGGGACVACPGSTCSPATCAAGVCGRAPVPACCAADADCGPDDVCATHRCDPETGTCQHVYRAPGTPCSGGGVCCGEICCPSPPANATATCSGGVCGFACAPGAVSCGGACVDTRTDANNCGGCGAVCPAGMRCANAACVPRHVASFGESDLYLPRGVAVDAAGTTAWIADAGNSRIMVWTKSGGAWWAAASFGQACSADSASQTDPCLSTPEGVAIDATGTSVWVADPDNNRIVVWTNGGGTWSHVASFGAFGTDGLSQPLGVAVNGAGTTTWAVDTGNNRVTVWTKTGGAWSFVESFGVPCAVESCLDGPEDIALDATFTTAWIADTGNNRIAVWSKAGGTWTAIAAFGEHGDANLTQTDPYLSRPMGLAVDAAGTTVRIADVDHSRIVTWVKSGGTWSHVSSFGIEGTTNLTQTDPYLDYPEGVAVAGTTAWVADTGNNRIAVWEI